MEIELNEQFKKAIELMENTNKHVFIKGKAGTGKSTLLNYFRSKTKKKIVVLAPTGVSALNVKGETIHSFFGFRPNVTIQNIKTLPKKDTIIYKNIDTIIIDEISMVRADLLDCVDYFLRLNGKDKNIPFGGIQMIFIGDLYQLPPVVTSKEKELFRRYYKSEYFFDAKVFKEINVEFIELEKVYRQSDEKFIELLNEIRRNELKEESLTLLNSRVYSNPPSDDEYLIYLTPYNEIAKKINIERLNTLKGKLYQWNALVYGEFNDEFYPNDLILSLKKGAQVMMLNNDSLGRWVNGSVGKVVGIKNNEIIKVRFNDGRIEDVTPYTWEIFHYKYDEKRDILYTETLGTFTQYPLKLAWAITIHKSQGKTFDKIYLDLGKGAFAPGQVYVALSRCTSFDGIYLKRPIKRNEIFIDKRIVKFITNFQYTLSKNKLSLNDKINIVERAIAEDKFLSIIYLKTNDEKTKRIIKPYSINKFSYKGENIYEIIAYCNLRKENRVFRLDRILEMDIIDYVV
jgi:ATP-dependent exoDNAse (exonuclease V) alpha subunit